MLMKVFNKGQVVIPADIRKELGIEVGDLLDVAIDKNGKSVKLHKPEEMQSNRLAGSLSKYNRRRRFPTKREMRTALAEGLSREK